MIFLLPGGIEVSVIYPIGVEDGRSKGASVSRTGVEATFELVDLDDVDLGLLELEYGEPPPTLRDAPPTLRDEEAQAFGLGRRPHAGHGLDLAM